MKKHLISLHYYLLFICLVISYESYANQPIMPEKNINTQYPNPNRVEIKPFSDIQGFQKYFFDRFPNLSLEKFSGGVYSLYTNNDERYEILKFPPYEIALEEGKEIFNTRFRNGKTFVSCFKKGGIGIKSSYPYFNQRTGEVHTLEYEINQCLKKNGEKLFKYGKGKIASVSAYMAYTTRGQKTEVRVPDDPRALEAYQKGKTFFYARRGQLNLSCAHCHVDNSGNKIRADLLSPALGHMSHFPVYRAKWGGMGTAHRRFAGCNKQVRALPFKLQSLEYRNLEYFLTSMGNGIPWNGPDYRK